MSAAQRSATGTKGISTQQLMRHGLKAIEREFDKAIKERVVSPILEQPLRFQGQQFDEETGLHYNRFRYYNPVVGRSVSEDPIKLMGEKTYFSMLLILSHGLTRGAWKNQGDERKLDKVKYALTLRTQKIQTSSIMHIVNAQPEKKEVVINKDGTQSHGSRGDVSDLTRAEKKYLKNKGFNIND